MAYTNRELNMKEIKHKKRIVGCNQSKIQVIFKLPKNTQRRFAAYAGLNGLTMQEILEHLVEEFMKNK